MKHTFKLVLFVAVAAATIVTLSSFLKKKTASTVAEYSIVLVSKTTSGTITEWSWALTNTCPGNGTEGTLQDVSNWSMPLNAAAEAALTSAFYSYDGVTWHSVSATIDRNPSIRYCTTNDVLKFDVGTTGTTPTYYRACFDGDFAVNAFATSWIKTGGGQEGCNFKLFSGIGGSIN
jgi:hypothetical protein